MTNPTEPGAASVSEHSLREQVARIVDGPTWSLIDHWRRMVARPDLLERCDIHAKPSLDKADRILALTTPARSSGEMEPMREALLVTRGSIGDLRKGFAKSVDPTRWVEQAIAYIDAALTPNANEAAVAGDGL